MDLVSIIVPVYNCKYYLDKCITSILDQSWSNIQVIVIDDGSTDGSGQLCDDFAKVDPRIDVIHQPNGGVSRARNKGLDLATGEWVLFVDSDDYVEPDYCRRMITTAQCSECDVVIARPRVESLPEIHHYGESEIEYLQKTCLAFDEKQFPYNVDGPWGKLFRRSILEDHRIRFPENLSRSEDAWFCATVYYYAQEICSLNWFGYVHVEREGSLCRRFFPGVQEMLERILTENLRWVENHHPGDQSYLAAVFHRVLPGIVECENQFFLHPQASEPVWNRAVQYQKFLSRPVIRQSIQNIDRSMVSSSQLRLRLLLYRMNLGWLFFLLKQNRR